MEYLVADFKIECAEDLFQVARDLLADTAASAGFESFEDTANGIEGYVQKSLFNKAVLDDGIEDFPLQNTEITYDIHEAEDKDWNEAWEQNGFEPINIQNKIIIEDAKDYKESGSDSKSTSNPQRILIDAKLAFGTGTHQTTQMIVSTLLNLDLKGKRVLDCGCGTGILGIVASKLGAEGVTAYDIDEWSVKNTRHNADINNVKNINVLLGDGSVLDSIEGEFDVVIANINRNILLHDMTAMRKKLAPSGFLILSGFYEDDIHLLKEKGESLGLKIIDTKKDSDWRCLVLR